MVYVCDTKYQVYVIVWDTLYQAEVPLYSCVSVLLKPIHLSLLGLKGKSASTLWPWSLLIYHVLGFLNCFFLAYYKCHSHVLSLIAQLARHPIEQFWSVFVSNWLQWVVFIFSCCLLISRVTWSSLQVLWLLALFNWLKDYLRRPPTYGSHVWAERFYFIFVQIWTSQLSQL